MPRLFTGLEIPAELGETLAMLRGGLPGARWIDPENYHLTLRFIGDVDDDIALEIASVLGRVRRGSLIGSLKPSSSSESSSSNTGRFTSRSTGADTAGAAFGASFFSTGRPMGRQPLVAGNFDRPSQTVDGQSLDQIVRRLRFAIEQEVAAIFPDDEIEQAFALGTQEAGPDRQRSNLPLFERRERGRSDAVGFDRLLERCAERQRHVIAHGEAPGPVFSSTISRSGK